jgi:four helix bundle protein
MDLVEMVYRATAGFPTEERYGLMSQLRRAAVSIPSNIAEGQSRRSSRDFAHFLTIAQGSRAELETQTLIATRLNLFNPDCSTPILEAAAEVGRLIHGLVNSLERV